MLFVLCSAPAVFCGGGAVDTTELEVPAAALLRKKELLHTADSHHLGN